MADLYSDPNFERTRMHKALMYREGTIIIHEQHMTEFMVNDGLLQFIKKKTLITE